MTTRALLPRSVAYLGPGLFLLAACVGLDACTPRAPDVIEAEIARTSRNSVTVVEFVDYECPFCRAMDDTMAPVLREHARQLRVVRKQVPLRRHPEARDAARAAVCADAAGKGDAMHEQLMHAADLSLPGLVALAGHVGLDPEALSRCMRDPRTEARLRADEAEADAAGVDGVPTVFIGRHKLVGIHPEQDIRDAVLDTLRQSGE